jgi:alkyl hydroperoxide reductase subunit AhpC
MDLYKIIGDLVDERNRIARIIESLQEAAGSGEVVTAKKRRGRKSMDPKARREVSERMRRYWAQRRQEKESPSAS